MSAEDDAQEAAQPLSLQSKQTFMRRRALLMPMEVDELQTLAKK